MFFVSTSLLILTIILSVQCFSPSLSLNRVYSYSPLSQTPPQNNEWNLFKLHHAPGSWKGVWTSYNIDGDVIDETIASIDYALDASDDSIQQTHLITVGASRADCQTWMRTKTSFETKSFPVATYTEQNLRKLRLVSVSMVNGPTFLRTGVLSTELVLSHGDGRVRAIFQHAPSWGDDVRPLSNTPPNSFELFRVIVSREAIRASPPTVETEAKDPPSEGNAAFFRPVPPLFWHKMWGGKSCTWDIDNGHKSDLIPQLQEVDAWHENPRRNDGNIWSMRLLGGILLQSPRNIGVGEQPTSRLAWIPVDDVLLRVEATISALCEPNQGGTSMLNKTPLHRIKCDVFEEIGEAKMQVIENEEEFIRPNEASSPSKKNDSDDSFDNLRSSLTF
mmetsp:Transcript_18169/g.25201  ORF Transcript_18169/g.25201 Transcript_18169/m.25201 type:complete len:390 (-) Transcript_18169:1930-3099(-)